MLVFREARINGIHSGMAYFSGECGYQVPAPLEPEDEMMKLQRQYIEATQVMAGIAKRMEKMTSADSPLKAIC